MSLTSASALGVKVYSSGSVVIKMVVKKNEFETAIIEFYREEIRQRYQLDRLHETTEFGTIPDAMLDSLREFFLKSLYPPAKDRTRMDEAFDDMLSNC